MIDVAGQKPDVGLLIEAALGEHGLVEQTQTGRDQAEQRRRAAEHPERRRAQRRREGQPVIRRVPPAGSERSRSRGPFAQQQDDRRGEQHQPERDLRPGGAPAADADGRADGDERRREEHAQQHRVDAHRDADAPVERLADGGDAGDRQRALPERPRRQHEQEQHQAPPARRLMRPHDARRAAPSARTSHRAGRRDRTPGRSAGRWPRRAASPRD